MKGEMRSLVAVGSVVLRMVYMVSCVVLRLELRAKRTVGELSTQGKFKQGCWFVRRVLWSIAGSVEEI
jgi:hypothetical protein